MLFSCGFSGVGRMTLTTGTDFETDRDLRERERLVRSECAGAEAFCSSRGSGFVAAAFRKSSAVALRGVLSETSRCCSASRRETALVRVRCRERLTAWERTCVTRGDAVLRELVVRVECED